MHKHMICAALLVAGMAAPAAAAPACPQSRATYALHLGGGVPVATLQFEPNSAGFPGWDAVLRVKDDPRSFRFGSTISNGYTQTLLVGETIPTAGSVILMFDKNMQMTGTGLAGKGATAPAAQFVVTPDLGPKLYYPPEGAEARVVLPQGAWHLTGCAKVGRVAGQ
jgi:hypothetical protein